MSCKVLESGAIVVLACLLLRWAVSLHPYSGAGKKPMYGDYEAQRHWQEITVNLPISSWYTNSTTNDLLYWGLDYPPLTAYHSLLNGKIAEILNPDYVALNVSRGFESYEHKVFMRYTVFLCDLLIFIPAVYFFKKVTQNRLIQSTGPSSKLCYMALLAYPGLYLIDYGHFQYNNVSLGLFIASVAAVIDNFDCLGSFLFSLALNYKQMELYHALPFFFFLLIKCLREKSLQLSVWKLCGVGASVIGTFIVVWSPYLYEISTVSQVLNRVFPIGRGLFEDKVANIWCSLSILIKFKILLNNSQMALICLMSTALFSLPSCINLFKNSSGEKFKYSLVNVSIVFFLFSYHVHEKSILLVAIPACLIYGRDLVILNWFFVVSVFSMMPLLVKDGLMIPSLALVALWMLLHELALAYSVSMKHFTPFDGTYSVNPDDELTSLASVYQKYFNIGYAGSLACMASLTAAVIVLDPPERYPDLYPVLIALVSCGHFVAFAVYFHYRQFTLSAEKVFRKSKKVN